MCVYVCVHALGLQDSLSIALSSRFRDFRWLARSQVVVETGAQNCFKILFHSGEMFFSSGKRTFVFTVSESLIVKDGG